jgi:hypothetical protein
MAEQSADDVPTDSTPTEILHLRTRFCCRHRAQQLCSVESARCE